MRQTEREIKPVPFIVVAHPDDTEVMMSGAARLEGAHVIVATDGEGSTVNNLLEPDFRRYLC
jgi:LmbE family N-acetylglucosaminyl deacetylase